ncbi:hypothetical protein QKU48_gp0560 [Fadolivirus algeromassiliense]|jgi:hypothetical protein|uniref:Uncharacterized protein n=1 Tax=Fadolivirus FV1/VV64 TaxID=3070911 RepID=A0A7D3R1S3_9VIRU|nr:hypothetical protein QKU48_gp0560 [Fadolivirus algeromassiliense]QKF94018.1 hypothetical protein Fadolivirus_1_560 [Fadolivirus FV1/VV64]
MELLNYNQIILNELKLNQPIFDHDKDIFISELVKDDIKIGIKGVNFKCININNNELNLEFLFSNSNFYTLMMDLDKYVKEQIVTNGSEWFGNKLNENTINNIYKCSINLPNKIPALPYIRFICSDECKIIKKRKKISLSELNKNMELEIDFVIDGVCYYKNKCHLQYTIVSIKVINDICQSFESLFNDSEEDNDVDNDISISTNK